MTDDVELELFRAWMLLSWEQKVSLIETVGVEPDD